MNRRIDNEPIKRISLAVPWSLYLQIVESNPISVNAEIIRLLKVGTKVLCTNTQTGDMIKPR